MRVFVGASSIEEIPEKYTKDCTELLEVLLKDNDLVFGAYNVGLMGKSYEIAKKNHRKVTGICPEHYRDSLIPLECDKEEVTKTMLDSTLKIYQDSDVMVLLPGGLGTLYEFFTANYSKVCKEINIPIILYNSCGYYDKLLDYINDICKNSFIREQDKHYLVANNKEEVMNIINSMETL